MNGYLKIKTTIDNTGVDKQILQLENKLNDLKATLSMASEDKTLFSKSEIISMEAEVEKLSNSLVKLKNKQAESDLGNWETIKSSIDSANKGIQKTIKSVGKWALAVFGLRTIYLGIRAAMGILSSENEQISADVEYIRSALANAIKPVVETLISLTYKLLQYLNAISMAWFGVNLFANSSAKAMSKAEASAASMKKSLAGFDEMNVITDTSTSSSSAGGGAVAPSVDLSQIQGEVPGWLQWILDNKDEILAFFTGLAIAIVAVKLGFEGLTALGIGLIFAGLYLTIQGIIDFIKDPSWENFLTILEGIALIVAGISILMGGWMVALIALGVAIVTYLIKNWDKVKEILGVVGDWIYSKVIKPVGDFFVDLWNGIKSVFSNVGDFFKDVFSKAWNNIKSAFSSVKSIFTNIFNTIKDIFKNIGSKIGEVTSNAFNSAINGALAVIETILNTPIKAINKLLDLINTLPGVNLSKIKEFKLPRLASGGIVNNPGRGVPIGGAIAGETGREGVIPLTDPYAMQTLGQEIGKWITVNNSSNIYLDGKLIQKNQDKVREELAFATNGGKR